MLRGLMSSWTKLNIPRKTRIGQTPPTHHPTQLFWWKHVQQKTNKQKMSTKKSELGLDTDIISVAKISVFKKCHSDINCIILKNIK